MFSFEKIRIRSKVRLIGFDPDPGKKSPILQAPKFTKHPLKNTGITFSDLFKLKIIGWCRRNFSKLERNILLAYFSNRHIYIILLVPGADVDFFYTSNHVAVILQKIYKYKYK